MKAKTASRAKCRRELINDEVGDSKEERKRAESKLVVDSVSGVREQRNHPRVGRALVIGERLQLTRDKKGHSLLRAVSPPIHHDLKIYLCFRLLLYDFTRFKLREHHIMELGIYTYLPYMSSVMADWQQVSTVRILPWLCTFCVIFDRNCYSLRLPPVKMYPSLIHQM